MEQWIVDGRQLMEARRTNPPLDNTAALSASAELSRLSFAHRFFAHPSRPGLYDFYISESTAASAASGNDDAEEDHTTAMSAWWLPAVDVSSGYFALLKAKMGVPASSVTHDTVAAEPAVAARRFPRPYADVDCHVRWHLKGDGNLALVAAPPFVPPVVSTTTISAEAAAAACGYTASHVNDEWLLFNFTVGAGEVPQALEELVLSMEVGEYSRCLCDPAFAFRDGGSSVGTVRDGRSVRGFDDVAPRAESSSSQKRKGVAAIPPHAVALLEVKLIAFENPPGSQAEVLQRATVKKDEGNKAVQAKDWRLALALFRKALDITTKTSPSCVQAPSLPQAAPPSVTPAERRVTDDDLRRLQAIVHHNLAVVNSEGLQQFDDALRGTYRSACCDPTYGKAYVRRVLTFMLSERFNDAHQQLDALVPFCEAPSVEARGAAGPTSAKPYSSVTLNGCIMTPVRGVAASRDDPSPARHHHPLLDEATVNGLRDRIQSTEEQARRRSSDGTGPTAAGLRKLFTAA